MIGLTKEDEIIRQVNLAKASEFGVTGIKIELEANFNRSGVGPTYVVCEHCNSEGFIRHNVCSGYGCDPCHNDGRVQCMKCFDERKHWGSVNYCYTWLLRRLKEVGLAYYSRAHQRYYEKQPLVFSLFYQDPSVGSEWTATLSLADPADIFKLPELVKAWKALGDAIGRGIEVRNAGMHTSFLNDATCHYPSVHVPEEQLVRFSNFRRSMKLLLPALYFLGSDNSHARSLHFRVPRVSDGHKFSAIHYTGGAIEFRVFETCYDNPERVLDNFIVMRNCLRFWTSEYRSPKLERLIEKNDELYFGNDDTETIDRLYTSVMHIDMLNAGIRKLKPAYKTIKQLKEERAFTIDKKSIRRRIKDQITNARVTFKEYEQRAKWQLEAAKLSRRAVLMSGYTPQSPEEISAIQETIDQSIARYEQTHMVQTLEQYVQQAIQAFQTRNRGAHRLEA